MLAPFSIVVQKRHFEGLGSSIYLGDLAALFYKVGIQKEN